MTWPTITLMPFSPGFTVSPYHPVMPGGGFSVPLLVRPTSETFSSKSMPGMDRRAGAATGSPGCAGLPGAEELGAGLLGAGLLGAGALVLEGSGAGSELVGAGVLELDSFGADGRGSGVAVSPGAGAAVGLGAEDGVDRVLVLVGSAEDSLVLDSCAGSDAEDLDVEDFDSGSEGADGDEGAALDDASLVDEDSSAPELGEGLSGPEVEAAITGECSSAGSSSSPNQPARAPASTTPPAPTSPRPAKVAVLFSMVTPPRVWSLVVLARVTSRERSRNAPGTLRDLREQFVNSP